MSVPQVERCSELSLRAGEPLPNWMMRSEVQDVVRAELMMKHAVFQD